MIWALLFFVIGGYLCLSGFSGSMSDTPSDNVEYGREFIFGLGFLGLSVIALIIRIWTLLH